MENLAIGATFLMCYLPINGFKVLHIQAPGGRWMPYYVNDAATTIEATWKARAIAASGNKELPDAPAGSYVCEYLVKQNWTLLEDAENVRFIDCGG
jgi:hypothetical protein